MKTRAYKVKAFEVILIIDSFIFFNIGDKGLLGLRESGIDELILQNDVDT